MALADVYDALVSKRVYKGSMTHEDAAQEIRAGRGTHFDPDVVEAFDAVEGLLPGDLRQLQGLRRPKINRGRSVPMRGANRHC